MKVNHDLRHRREGTRGQGFFPPSRRLLTQVTQYIMELTPALSDLLSEGQKTNEELAAMFGVSEIAIKKIRAEHDKLVAEDEVSDTAYLAWCKQLDDAYPHV